MKTLVISVSVIVVLVLALFAIGPAIVKAVAFRGESPDFVARYEDWKGKDLEIPAEALEIEPVSSETKAAAEAFVKDWESSWVGILAIGQHYPLYSVRKGNDFSGKKINYFALQRDIQPYLPLLESYESLISLEDFRKELFAEDLSVLQQQGSSIYLVIQAGSKMLSYKALCDVHAGRDEEALNTAEAIVQGSVTHPYDSLISQLIAVACCSIGTTAWGEVVMQCDDPRLLRQTLARQNELAGRLAYFSGPVPIQAIDHIAKIRAIKRAGWDVEIGPMTSRELMAKACELEADYALEMAYPVNQGSVTMSPSEKSRLETLQSNSASLGGKYYSVGGLFKKLSGRLSLPVLYKVMAPNMIEAQTRVELTLSRFDLLRLETAKRIYRLEGGQAPADLSDLTPEFLPEPVFDRFGVEGAAHGQSRSGDIYALGPDRVDQGGALAYDPTNGSLSAGDVWLGRIRIRKY